MGMPEKEVAATKETDVVEKKENSGEEKRPKYLIKAISGDVVINKILVIPHEANELSKNVFQKGKQMLEKENPEMVESFDEFINMNSEHFDRPIGVLPGNLVIQISDLDEIDKIRENVIKEQFLGVEDMKSDGGSTEGKE